MPMVLLLAYIVHPPQIGRLVGITVGVTTLNQFKREYGEGGSFISDHSKGGGLWYDPTLGIQILADGMHYGNDGLIFDVVGIQWHTLPRDQGVPFIRLRKNEIGFIKDLKRGMTPGQVEAKLHLKLNPKREVVQTGLIRYTKIFTFQGADSYTGWKAWFYFESNRLTGLSVRAEEGRPIQPTIVHPQP